MTTGESVLVYAELMFVRCTVTVHLSWHVSPPVSATALTESFPHSFGTWVSVRDLSQSPMPASLVLNLSSHPSVLLNLPAVKRGINDRNKFLAYIMHGSSAVFTLGT